MWCLCEKYRQRSKWDRGKNRRILQNLEPAKISCCTVSRDNWCLFLLKKGSQQKALNNLAPYCVCLCCLCSWASKSKSALLYTHKYWTGRSEFPCNCRLVFQWKMDVWFRSKSGSSTTNKAESIHFLIIYLHAFYCTQFSLCMFVINIQIFVLSFFFSFFRFFFIFYFFFTAINDRRGWPRKML